jgi:hypothetical protein
LIDPEACERIVNIHIDYDAIFEFRVFQAEVVARRFAQLGGEYDTLRYV